MTQNQMILRYMDDFGSISTMEAFVDLGVTRLASRIHEIISSGVAIEKEMVHSKNRYGKPISYMRYRRG